MDEDIDRLLEELGIELPDVEDELDEGSLLPREGDKDDWNWDDGQ